VRGDVLVHTGTGGSGNCRWLRVLDLNLDLHRHSQLSVVALPRFKPASTRSRPVEKTWARIGHATRLKRLNLLAARLSDSQQKAQVFRGCPRFFRPLITVLSQVRVLPGPPAFARFASYGSASHRVVLERSERRLPRRSPKGEGGPKSDSERCCMTMSRSRMKSRRSRSKNI
jgi:hypothetical protein